jgi:enoyl-CoA hydratase/carnithine racemase
MPYTTLAVDRRSPLAEISLIRPGTGNRIDRRLLRELEEAVERSAADSGTRAVIVTGSNGVFSQGWDDAVIHDLQSAGVEAAEPGLLGSTFQFLVESPLPVIAAINGDALSAGFELALACDVRVAALTATFGLPDTGEGRIPMAGGTQRLARLAGRGCAVEMILTGRTLTASEALGVGILNSICEPTALLETARRLGLAIAGRGPQAVMLAKEAVYRGLEMPLEQALRYETDLTVLLQTTADRTEGVQAFVEKREPRFEGR